MALKGRNQVVLLIVILGKMGYNSRMMRWLKVSVDCVRPVWLSIPTAALLTLWVFSLTGAILVFLPLTFRLRMRYNVDSEVKRYADEAGVR